MKKLSMVLTFKLTLGAYAVLALFILFKILFVGPSSLPETAMAYHAWLDQQPLSELARIASWTSLLATGASIGSAVAMAAFMSWSRFIFAASICLLIASEAMMDLPILKTPSETLADSMLGVLAGGAIALSYWSELAHRFVKQTQV